MVEVRAAEISRPRVQWMLRAATLLVTAIVLALSVGWSWLLVGFVAVAVATWPLVGTDISEHRLPNKIVLPCYPAAVVGLALHSITTGASPVLAIVSSLGCIVVFALMHVLGGMGMGDVKLVGVLGLLLGSLGVTALTVGLASAFLLGAVAGAWAMATQRRAATHRIPFGPFLLVGFWLGVLAPVLRHG
ncbi:prepilin peptidase [Paramicrobacterium fandaimingii]|uniref:prepilin peptidase n=1 Tax=Paramicrobacterium fandaimingii TaxID=2708079 RepID=UPI00141E07B2|nr:A24 family peptidase [Microbacterium fandaimingii]